MKKLHLTTLFVVLLCMVSISLYAQLTTMTIDNQTPGWLSSKINYGDQQTLVNLKVTGYINNDDLTFLDQLSTKHNLQVLDLEEVHFVASGNGDKIIEDDVSHGAYYGLSLHKLTTSKYVRSESEYNDATFGRFCFFNDEYKADTVIIKYVYKCYVFSTEISSSKIKFIIFPEGVEELGGATPIVNSDGIIKQSMWLPSTIKALTGLRVQNCNITSFVENPENITFKVRNAGVNSKIYNELVGDTLWVPMGTKEKYLNTDFKSMKKIIEMAPPSEIVLNEKKLKLYINETNDLKASISPESTYFKGLIWKSTDENVVTVSQTGEVIGTGYGTASVVVCSEKDESIADTCIVNVYEHTTGISISQTNTEVNVGETIELSAYTMPQGTTDNELVWRSSNEEVATVNSNGKVTALKLGVCTISATAIDGGSTAECFVTVIQPANSISMNKHYLSIRVGSYEELQATVSPDNTTYKEVKWASSNNDVAEVSERGIVTAKKAGKAYISAHSISNSNVKDSCEVVVLQPVTGIKMDEESITFEGIGKTMQLIATVLPDDASDKALRWSSSNTSVCTVSDGGFIVAVGIGVSVVTATTVDGGFVAVCIVTVKETDGIVSIDIDSLNGNEWIYDAQGKRIAHLQRGINIIRMNDGTIRKVVVK